MRRAINRLALPRKIVAGVSCSFTSVVMFDPSAPAWVLCPLPGGRLFAGNDSGRRGSSDRREVLHERAAVAAAGQRLFEDASGYPTELEKAGDRRVEWGKKSARRLGVNPAHLDRIWF